MRTFSTIYREHFEFLAEMCYNIHVIILVVLHSSQHLTSVPTCFNNQMYIYVYNRISHGTLVLGAHVTVFGPIPSPRTIYSDKASCLSRNAIDIQARTLISIDRVTRVAEYINELEASDVKFLSNFFRMAWFLILFVFQFSLGFFPQSYCELWDLYCSFLSS